MTLTPPALRSSRRWLSGWSGRSKEGYTRWPRQRSQLDGPTRSFAARLRCCNSSARHTIWRTPFAAIHNTSRMNFRERWLHARRSFGRIPIPARPGINEAKFKIFELPRIVCTGASFRLEQSFLFGNRLAARPRERAMCRAGCCRKDA